MSWLVVITVPSIAALLIRLVVVVEKYRHVPLLAAAGAGGARRLGGGQGIGVAQDADGPHG